MTGTKPQGNDVPANARHTSRWVMIALVASLAVNLVGITALGGAYLRTASTRERLVAVRETNFGALAAAFDRSDRQSMRRAFLAQIRELSGQRQAVHTDLEALADLLSREPFDRPAAEALFARQASRTVDRVALGQKVVLDHLAGLKPDGRQSLAKNLAAELAGRRN